MKQQLTLRIQPREAYSFANFNADGNAHLVAQLRTEADHYYLYGAPGSGKSHLLQALIQEQESRGLQVILLSLAEVKQASPEVLQGLEAFNWLALDDLDAVRTEPAWEEALFNLYNRCLAAGTHMAFSAREPAQRIGLQLPDLVSRLSACRQLQVTPLNEAGQRQVLSERAHQRGMQMPPAVIDYIMSRSQRGTAALMALLDELDQASLAEQRRLTVPFVKQVMARLSL